MLTHHGTAGRPENVHSVRVLWDLRRYSTDGAEYDRGTSRARRTTLVRRRASKFPSLDIPMLEKRSAVCVTRPMTYPLSAAPICPK